MVAHGEEDPVSHGKARSNPTSKGWPQPMLLSMRDFIFLLELSLFRIHNVLGAWAKQALDGNKRVKKKTFKKYL